MRIIAGKYKGRKLKGPRGREFRPTSDRVKEAIFNILQGSVAGKDVLDLYAGSGSLGLEALSRGAGSCVFVEINKFHARILKNNIQNIAPEDKIRVYICPVEQAIKRLKNDNLYFDLVFLDPPYQEEILHKTLFLLSEPGGIIKKDVVIVAEHSSKAKPFDSYGTIYKTREYIYGDTAISFFCFHKTDNLGGPENGESYMSGKF